jgi:arylformamidase
MLYDLSPPITPAVAVFPGDTPPSREVLLDMRRGDPLTLSTLRTTVHVGTHVDGANHYGKDAPGVDAIPLERMIGPAHIITVRARRGARFGHADLASVAITNPRVLLRTGTHPDPNHFNPDFAAPDPALIDWLADRGVNLIGVDTPSVDAADSKDLPSHARCLARGVTILEGLRLEAVPDGIYELIALPLRLAGFDASPVRAVLRTN